MRWPTAAAPLPEIFSAEPDEVDPDVLQAHLQRLKELAFAGDAEAVRAELAELVPDFGIDKSAERPY